MSSKKQNWANAHSQLWTSPAPRSAGSRTQSEVSSIASPNRDRSLLEDVDAYEHLNTSSAVNRSRVSAFKPQEKTLVQVSDILESYGAIAADADIPSVLLRVVKELEEAKRDNNYKDLLLREYEEAVRRRFSMYGEDVFPSVNEVSRRLRDDTAAELTAPPAPLWVEDELSSLRGVLQDTMHNCFGDDLEFALPMLLPDAARTRANLVQLLRQCKEALAKLSGEYCSAKEAINARLNGTNAVAQSVPSLTLAEALAELDSHKPLGGESTAAADLGEAGRAHTLRGAVRSIVDAVPASLQIHFGLQVADAPVLAQCEKLTQLVQFLLAEYLSMEHYMEGVEAQRLKLVEVFRLLSSDAAHATKDDATQIEDALAQSLSLLQKTVTAVVTFPHQISEDELKLRRATEEAVEELAQLLVESRASGVTSTAAGAAGATHAMPLARIEPPTRSLSEMVDLVKSRFATLLSQQQRKELAGMQGRVGHAHMEEAMKTHGKQIMQQLRELCTTQDDAGAAESTEVLSEVISSLDVERNFTPARLDYFLSDVVERLRVVKTKVQRALNAASSHRTRAEAAALKSAAAQKKLHKVAAYVDRIGREGLGLTFPAKLGSTVAEGDDDAEEGGRGDGISALRRLNLRPTANDSDHKAAAAPQPRAAAPSGAATVTEANVLEALQFLTTRLCANEALRDQLKLSEEVEQLRRSQAHWKADTAAFHEAMAMLMQRLASNGQMVKRTLFMMGTDESAKDELVEEVLQRGEAKATDEAAEVEYVERTLAELLQKYTRWAQRLEQTSEDHLYTQRKIVKYFAAVRRFFTARQSGELAAAAEDIPDDNLYDIDACLMRAADVILPALDAAIQGADGQRAVTAEKQQPAASSSSSGATAASDAAALQRTEVIAQLAKDSAASGAGGVLPYDHRIARLYDMVARLYTAVTSLLQVHYLCLPTAVRRRSSGDVELVFDGDGAQDGFIDLDLDRLIRVSQRRSPGEGDGAAGERQRFAREAASGSTTTAAATTSNPSSTADRGSETNSTTTLAAPASTVAANNDVILRVTYQNMEVLQDTLKRFSANHKMAAIVLQKDMDAMQQQLAAMLEKYSEVDMETAFGQSREELHELYLTLRDRATVQKGCYFFNRIDGEGSCAWVTALNQLGDGFRGVVDRLVRRTAQAAEYRELTAEVVDLCAMYVNWAEQHALPPTHGLPADLLEQCVRDGVTDAVQTVKAGSDGGKEEAPQSAAPPPPLSPSPSSTGAVAAAARRPPKPSSATRSLTPRDSIKQQQQQQDSKVSAAPAGGEGKAAAGAEAKVSRFVEDRTVLRVIEHMFRLAQCASESTTAITTTTAAAAREGGKTADAAATAAAVQEAEARAQRLAEELSLLREAVAVAERHVDELTESRQAVERQRDQAQSEAAVARAELRRWKRLQQQQQQQEEEEEEAHSRRPTRPANVSPRPSSVSDGSEAASPAAAAAHGAAMDEATVREVVEYMKVLSQELQSAKERAGAEVPRESAGLVELVRSPYTGALEDHERDTSDESAAEHDNRRTPQPLPHQDHHHHPSRHNNNNSSSSNTRRGAAAVEAAEHGVSASTPATWNRYTSLADELRHRYGSAALAPMVVVDPRSHYTRPAATQQQQRYSPVKFRGPAYDACDRYYTRELADREGERRPAPARQPTRSSSSAVAATMDVSAGLAAGQPQHQRTPQRRRRLHSREEEEEDDERYDAQYGYSAGRRSVMAVSAAAAATAASGTRSATTPQRYPRTLRRDAPLQSPLADRHAAPATSPQRVAVPPMQRATPVSATRRRRSSAHPHVSPPPPPPPSSPPPPPGSSASQPGRAVTPSDDDRQHHHHHARFSDTEPEEEVYYDNSDNDWRRDVRWHVPPTQGGRRQSQRSSLSATRQRRPSVSPSASSSFPPPAAAAAVAGSPGASLASASFSIGGRRGAGDGPSPRPGSPANLAEAVQQIKNAATTAPARGGRRGSAATTAPPPSDAGGVAAAAAPGAVSPEEQMNRNANLRSTALRRLAEVVSRTKVTSPQQRHVRY